MSNKIIYGIDMCMGKNDHNDLYTAFSKLETKDDIARFMADLCTPAELNAFAERWAIARLLYNSDLSYRDIAAQTGASTTTVARVARFLRHEPHQGYKIVLEQENMDV